jgi:hypothetical protein
MKSDSKNMKEIKPKGIESQVKIGDVSKLILNDFSNTMRNESDRACAVLGGSLLDHKLEQACQRRMINNKNLFEFNGPLGTFSSRILLAHSLAWIDDDIRNDLNSIRKIRNEFAHNVNHDYSLSEDKVVSLCENLVITAHYLKGFDESLEVIGKNVANHAIQVIKEKFSAPRWRFELAICFISQYLDELPGETPKMIRKYSLTDDVRELSKMMFVKKNESK